MNTKSLILAEKPGVASDIAKALKVERKGDHYENDQLVISSAVGHLIEIQCSPELAKCKSLETLPIIPPKFDLVPIERTAKQFRYVSKLLARSDVSTVINACDAGREGELIFRYIYMATGCKKPMKRMWMQSMTPNSIREAFTKLRPGSELDALFDSAISRSEADWLIGINGTRAVTDLQKRITGKWDRETVGRVQTPTLAILVDRELAIRNFVAKPYFEIHGKFRSKAGEYPAKWTQANFIPDKNNPDAKPERIFDKSEADRINRECHGVTPSGVTEETKPVSTIAPQLFDLTSLQQECNRKFGFSAKQTLDYAQSLYEKHKVLSYPRTDSCCLPEDYLPTASRALQVFADAGLELSKFAAQAIPLVKPNKRIFNDAKISDHFALIPTGKIPSDLSVQEKKVFDLVLLRFIAAFFPPAEFLQTVRTTIVAGHNFRSGGRVLVNAGWKAVYGFDADEKDDPPLAKISPGEIPQNIEIKTVSLETKAPPRFTEATLLAAMEGAGKLIEDEEQRKAMAKGLGTPATRGNIIEKLLVNKDGKGDPIEPYLVRKAKELIPTGKGEHIILFLRKIGLTILTSPETTGEWESILANIESRKVTRSAFMASIHDMTRKIVGKLQAQAANLPTPQNHQESKQAFNAKCPVCGASLEANQKVVSCPNNDFTLWKTIFERPLTDDEMISLIANGRSPVLTGFVSKKTGKSFNAALVLQQDGKVTFEFEQREAQSSSTASTSSKPKGEIGATCPTCKKGKLTRKETKDHKPFIGCTNFPDCKHFEWLTRTH